MTITERIMERTPRLSMSNEGAWDSPVVGLKGYHSFNDAGIECEVGEFLYSLVRLIKPKRVLETGTHWGVGALYMGLGLQDNGEGHLDTYEFIPEIHKIAEENLQMAGLWAGDGGPVKTYLKDVTKVKLAAEYELMLLDTEPQTRFIEMIRFWDNLAPGGFLFIHDLHRHMHQIPNEEHGFAWPFGKVPDKIEAMVASDFARPFHFPTPRGLTGFYKVSGEDYKWQKQQIQQK